MIEDLKHDHARDVRDFETLATKWAAKERDYKSEMKKLEVLLSNTEDGMEKVSLARSKSSVHGSRRAAEIIGRGISAIKARNETRNSKGKGQFPTPLSFPTTAKRFRDAQVQETGSKAAFQQNMITVMGRLLNQTVALLLTFKLAQHLSAPRANAVRQQNSQSDPSGKQSLGKQPKSTLYRRSIQRRSSSELQNSLEAHTRPNSTPQLSKLTHAQLETLERQQAEEDMGVSFDSSISAASSHSSRRETSVTVTRFGLGVEIPDKPLPRLPVTSQTMQIRTSDEFTTRSYSQFSQDSDGPPAPYQMGFSFNPGDDLNVLAQDGKESLVLDLPSPMITNPRVAESLAGAKEPGHKPDASFRKGISKVTVKPCSVPRDLQDFEPLKRDDSSCSAITAVRDHSGRSSATGSLSNSQSGRPKLNRGAGSSTEAITAAVRALSGTSAGIGGPKVRRLGSESGSYGDGRRVSLELRDARHSGKASAVAGTRASIASPEMSSRGADGRRGSMEAGGGRL